MWAARGLPRGRPAWAGGRERRRVWLGPFFRYSFGFRPRFRVRDCVCSVCACRSLSLPRGVGSDAMIFVCLIFDRRKRERSAIISQNSDNSDSVTYKGEKRCKRSHWVQILVFGAAVGLTESQMNENKYCNSLFPHRQRHTTMQASERRIERCPSLFFAWPALLGDADFF